MSFKEQFVSSLESIFLAAFMIWSVGIAIAVLSPETTPQGTVEIYSLVAAETQPTA